MARIKTGPKIGILLIVMGIASYFGNQQYNKWEEKHLQEVANQQQGKVYEHSTHNDDGVPRDQYESEAQIDKEDAQSASLPAPVQQAAQQVPAQPQVQQPVQQDQSNGSFNQFKNMGKM